MMEFSKGQRVICVKDFDYVEKGDTGVVAGERATELAWVPVRWDVKKDELHDCNGLCEMYHGWFIPCKYIAKTTEPINISELI